MAHAVVTAINFAGLNIPVVGSVTGTNPGAAYFGSAPVNFSQLGLTNEQAFNYGTGIGSASINKDPDKNTFSYGVNGGTTDLHNGAIVRVDAPYYQNNRPWHDVSAHLNGVRKAQANMWLGLTVPGTSPSGSNTSYDYNVVACGVTYSNTDWNPSYEIVSFVRYRRYDSEGEVVAESYNIAGGISVHPAKFFIDDGVDAWFDQGDPEPPIDPFDPSTPDPYRPDPDDTSDTITLPVSPTIGVTSAGFINIYNPGIRALQGLGDVLFPNVASATDTKEAIIAVCNTLMNQNLINYVIDCHVIPCQPTVGTSANIKVGFRDTGIASLVVTSDYVDVSCGALNLPEYFGGFADYITHCKIYLPFVGFVDTKPEYWQAGNIAIDYKFNIIDGSFMAYVRSASSKSQLNGSVIAQYGGNACMHLPITGANYAAMISGLVSAATGAAVGAVGGALTTGGAIGGAIGAVKGAVSGGAASAANAMVTGPTIAQSNGYNSTAAMLGVRYPYLLIERPVPSYPSNYRHDKGYPSNISTYLSYVSGFTIISDIDLSGIPLTAAEIGELRTILQTGAYF